MDMEWSRFHHRTRRSSGSWVCILQPAGLSSCLRLWTGTEFFDKGLPLLSAPGALTSSAPWPAYGARLWRGWIVRVKRSRSRMFSPVGIQGFNPHNPRQKRFLGFLKTWLWSAPKVKVPSASSAPGLVMAGRLRPGDPCPLRVPPPPGASSTMGMHSVSALFRSNDGPSRAGDGRGFPRT